MDYFTKNKMLFWCVVVLVILNVVMLSSFWLRKPPLGPRGGHGMRGGQIMEDKLKLSAEQAEQFERLRSEHFARTRPIQSDMHKIRLELVDEIFKSESDDATVQKLLAKLGDKNSQFEKDLFIHFQELKNACNDDQSAALKSMMLEIIESVRPSDPEQGPPGDRGPGHGPGPRPGPGFPPPDRP